MYERLLAEVYQRTELGLLSAPLDGFFMHAIGVLNGILPLAI